MLDENKEHHALLTKDALIAVSKISGFLLDENRYVFPVNFNEGFAWNLESDNYLFSVVQAPNNSEKYKFNNKIDFDLLDENGNVKHWMVAIENSKVVWIENLEDDKNSGKVAVLLESSSDKGVYYLYGNLSKRTLEIKEGQKLFCGELIGTVSNEKNWGEAGFLVLKSKTTPGKNNFENYVINFFPQLFEIYFNKSFSFSNLFSKGNIVLGSSNSKNDKNNLCFEEYTGKGWVLGCWNMAGKLPAFEKGNESNVRLQKIVFKGTNLESENPMYYYDYEINVNNGTYRIRVKVGDAELATWQKIEFENRSAGEFLLGEGRMEWTPERMIRVNDGKITIRIYIDNKNKPAGLSEIVFQREL